ncbi:alpha/beta hydrolase [Wenzhouxiangella sp. XN24]|uniref:alpha/beta fold hydrolase n=1 Tax=Wenzhouxiangella sp. XN24 TaxID=2713569 RepID=UPI0013ECE0D2|nr:alpha/beta hydrolase [Wenzhouxiangella sp. XN24]NGX17139.1 alpha/beta hydrolase [Wenzhouxiangella sp. XN24]
MTRSSVPAGAPVKHRLATDHRTRYLRFVPGNPDPQRPPLVCVHGISRDAEGHLEAFIDWAERTGTELLAPLFDRRRYRGYQRLRSSNRTLHPVAALDAMLDETVGDRPCLLYGFSGGAQFAHRYALVRPERVAGVALAAAGWYTFPTVAASFPYGLSPGRLPASLAIDFPAFLQLPKCVLVGDRDVERDPALRSNRVLDREQGDNRLARATAWVAALERAASKAGQASACRLVVVPEAGHDWQECYAQGRMHEHVARFFDDVCNAGQPCKPVADATSVAAP